MKRFASTVFSSRVRARQGETKAAGSLDRSAARDFWALRDVSFEIERGQAVGIIGRNGAGKSTLLKILSRITPPTSGRVSIEGQLASLLEVGTGFHGDLTGRENIFLNGAILGMTRKRVMSHFDAIVSFAGIERFLDTPVKRYSSGMYVRLGFAIAAHLDPDVLLVDEVLAVGDAEFQRRCLSKLGEVGREGRTVLFVSHDMNAVEQLCGAVMFLEEGRLKRYSADVRGCIREYIAGTEIRMEADDWRNPDGTFDNPWFRPSRFYVGDREGRSLASPFSNSEEIWIHIEGEIAQPASALTVGYAIYSADGPLLYWSYQTDLEEAEWPRLSPGHNHLRSRLPSRLLNEGMYRIELIASLHYQAWLLEPGVSSPALLITIQGGLSDSPYWMLKRPGLIAPVVTWERCETEGN